MISDDERDEFNFTTMTLVEDGPQIDLTKWEWAEEDGNFDSGVETMMDKVRALIDQEVEERMQCITDVIRDAFKRTPPDLSFPHVWSSSPQSDPVMLEVSLPLGAVEFENPRFVLSLEHVVNDVIAMHENPDGTRVEDPQGKTICRQIAARLHQLATKLEDACSPEAT